ncbi:UNKNOWN [Stylonychia lemnae]|uniref:Uncharacterized protein n=1 Tax=Stylonychia lemnae TaxID=5949 RepID=A0A078AJ78_STYLE|nr:UNKNOWN [Stylonychia lemnae]|eukprot:CDW81537.1 UNKNOWN [Stylonychia lemnae]
MTSINQGNLLKKSHLNDLNQTSTLKFSLEGKAKNLTNPSGSHQPIQVLKNEQLKMRLSVEKLNHENNLLTPIKITKFTPKSILRFDDNSAEIKDQSQEVRVIDQLQNSNLGLIFKKNERSQQDLNRIHMNMTQSKFSWNEFQMKQSLKSLENRLKNVEQSNISLLEQQKYQFQEQNFQIPYNQKYIKYDNQIRKQELVSNGKKVLRDINNKPPFQQLIESYEQQYHEELLKRNNQEIQQQAMKNINIHSSKEFNPNRTASVLGDYSQQPSKLSPFFNIQLPEMNKLIVKSSDKDINAIVEFNRTRRNFMNQTITFNQTMNLNTGSRYKSNFSLKRPYNNRKEYQSKEVISNLETIHKNHGLQVTKIKQTQLFPDVDLESEVFYQLHQKKKNTKAKDADTNTIKPWQKKTSIATSAFDINTSQANENTGNDYGIESIMKMRINNAKINNTIIGMRNVYGMMSSSDDEDEENIIVDGVQMKNTYQD